MRVLLANKFFRAGAGAETAFFATRDLLRDSGHDVIDFAMASADNLPSPNATHFARERHYDAGTRGLRQVLDAGASIYSPAARRAIRGLIRAERPEVAHLHNVYHQLTLSIVDELAANDVPVVMTLHDYKIVCPAYTLFTEGATCRRCVHGPPVHVVPHRCIKGSAAASAIGAAEAILVRAKGLYRKVDAFISPSTFLCDLAAEQVPRDRIHVIPNFLPEPAVRSAVAAAEREPIVLFAGRLETVKGIEPLLAAFHRGTRHRLRLVIAGDGPLRGAVESEASRNPSVEYVGRLERHEVDRRLRTAIALIVPSIWEENCPMVVLEARAAGTPVVAASTGGLPELIEDGEDGVLVDARSAASIEAGIDRLMCDGTDRDRMAAIGLERFRVHHSPSAHLQRLLDVYASARS